MNSYPVICYYSISTHLGGAERSLLELLTGLKKSENFKCVPWVLLPKNNGPLIDELKKFEIEFDVLPMPNRILEISQNRLFLSLLKFTLFLPLLGIYAFSLYKFLKKRKPALIHTTGVKCHLFGAIIGWCLSVPVLWHLRDIFHPGATRVLLKSVRRIFRLRCIANSKATAHSFDKNSQDCLVIYNGLNPQVYFPAHNREFNHLLGLTDKTLIVGIVGVLAKWKGQMQFLEMAHELITLKGSICEGVHFVVIGDEIYDTHGEKNFKQALIDKAEALGIKNKVYFGGFHKDAARAINGLDILVHASIKPEPFGRVIVEGFACKVPVVASQAGGVTELVSDGRTGLLFKPGQVKEMALQVEKLLSAASLRTSLSERAYEESLKNYMQDKHVDCMIQLYRTIGLK